MRALYDDLAELWARNEPNTHGDLIGLPVLLDFARRFGVGARVLDIGCGDGFMCRLLSPIAKHVVGIDNSPGMLDEAKSRSANFQNVEYVLGDMLDLRCLRAVDGAYDFCVGVNAVCCVETEGELLKVYQQIQSILRPGGRVAMQIPHPLDGQFEQPSRWFRDLDRLISYFESGQLIRRQLRMLNDRRVTVARHHFSLSTHMNAAVRAGLVLDACDEPRPTEIDIEQYPDLQRDARLPSVWIALWCRP